MKILVDTCGWIEVLTNGRLVEAYAGLLEDLSRVVIPTVVQYELYKWVRREGGERLALEVIARSEQAEVLPLSTAVALDAADLSREHRLAMADAMIYAHARFERVELVTSDAHFEGLDGVRLIRTPMEG